MPDEHVLRVADQTALALVNPSTNPAVILDGAGTFFWNPSNFASKVAADSGRILYVAPSSDITGASGAWQRQIEGYYNVKWWGALGAGGDDSTAIQAAIDTISALGGGTLYFPPGTWAFANVQMKPFVSIFGDGTGGSVFSSVKATVFKLLPSAPTDGVVAAAVTSGGTGYTTAPAVTVTGGGGTGAIVTAFVSGGAVTALRVADPGRGYTSPPTLSFSGGGGGTGAAGTTEVAARLLYSTGASLTTIALRGFSMRGNGAGQNQGIHLHDVNNLNIAYVSAGAFGLEAFRIDTGSGGSIAHLIMFGCASPARSSGYRTGAIRIGATDIRMMDVEAGADRSSDSAALRNCAFFFDRTSSAGLYVNLIAEGGDVGVYLEGGSSRFVVSAKFRAPVRLSEVV